MSGDDCSLDAQVSKQATPVFLLKYLHCEA
jgi:hypothetical protein